MACGVCAPDSFTQAAGGCIYGYTHGRGPLTPHAAHALYFQGAQFVLWDSPSRAPTLKRPQLARLLKLMRPGDILLLDRSQSLATKNAAYVRLVGQLAVHGVKVMVLSQRVAQNA